MVDAPGRRRISGYRSKTRAPGYVRGSEPRVSVIIPTLNEAQNLPHVFAELPGDLHEVIVVDGFSIDGTPEVARELRPSVRLVRQMQPGKGDALQCGFEAATGDILVMLDADGSANPAEIPAFVEALMNGADFAKGSRFREGGGSSDITHLRRVGNRGLNGIVNVLFGTAYSDLCYGYNAFWRHCLSAMCVDCAGFEVETLINIRIARAGLIVSEVPSFERGRLHGQTNLRTFRDGARVVRTIARERLRRAPHRYDVNAEIHRLGMPAADPQGPSSRLHGLGAQAPPRAPSAGGTRSGPAAGRPVGSRIASVISVVGSAGRAWTRHHD
jgi:glycosyltransferase involved in cell wall biosynthesis